jgi:hypothetical protein
MRNKKQDGFTTLMVEVLVGLSLLLVFFSVTAPSLKTVLQANNQNNAVMLLRSVNKSEGYYFRVFHNGYVTPAVLANSNAGQVGTVAAQTCQTPGFLGPETAASVSVTQTFSGYNYVFTPGAVSPITGSGCANPGYATYTLTASPITPGASGNFFYFTDQTGILRFAAGAPATATSPSW